jgi:hypothetical protein
LQGRFEKCSGLGLIGLNQQLSREDVPACGIEVFVFKSIEDYLNGINNSRNGHDKIG